MAERKTKKRTGRPDQGLGETQLFIRVTKQMKARLDRVVAQRSKGGSPTSVSMVVRDLLASWLATEERKS